MNPFFFNLGRARGPLAVGDAVLTPEDVFVLLGESLDLGYFAAQPRNLNLGYFKAEGSAAWRERLVRRFAPRGLVDASGEPCDELAEALVPVSGNGVYVGDGRSPGAGNPVDRRTAVVCLSADLSRATAVVRCGRGFRLRPFPADRSLWEAEFLDVFGLAGSYAPAERAQHYIGGGVDLRDTTFSDALKGGPAAVRSWCAERGVRDSSQLERVSELGNRLIPAISGKILKCTDLRESEFPEGLGYGTSIPVGGSFRNRGGLVFPEAGLVHFWGTAPREGLDWFEDNANIDRCRYAGFDFLGPGMGLMDNLTDFYDYPEGSDDY